MTKPTINCNCCNFLTWDYVPLKNHYTDSRRDTRSAGGILIHSGRVLIVQSRSNKWGFPKGGFERGESASQCAKREVLEETSFNVWFGKDDPSLKHKNTTFYIKHLQSKPPKIDTKYLQKPGNDCTGIGWIRLTCLKKMVNGKKITDIIRYKKNEDDSFEGLDSKENISTNEDPSMLFNTGIRNFVEQYIQSRKRL